jgi:hypothetical protein
MMDSPAASTGKVYAKENRGPIGGQLRDNLLLRSI